MKLEDIEIYQLSMEVGDEVWEKVKEWDKLAKFSMGVRVIKSADSIAANISEGY